MESSRPTKPQQHAGMDLAFLARVRKQSIITGLVLALPISLYFGMETGGGWIAGLVWSLVNLVFLSQVIKGVVTADDRQLGPIMIALLVKFPILYVSGFFLLRSEWFSVLGLVLGFSWPLVVMVLKAAGRAFLGLDNKSSDTVKLHG